MQQPHGFDVVRNIY